uniref:Uncharacterized protein n=1 Tax=Pyrodinium bahamense TaxID=73915 RepID=A0A7S0A569_9DINO|mmetsp:Transcript_23160/g.64246  ORF Transcript_23160/g.64246 Transcript_23160/m.64246 type:complete len:246 (+) Transcript_23160:77-814(+)
MAILRAVILFAALAAGSGAEIVDEMMLVQRWAGSSQPQLNASSDGTPIYLPIPAGILPIPVKIPFQTPAPIYNPYKQNATRFWNPAYDPDWVNPTEPHQPTKKDLCFTEKGERVNAKCVTDDGQWWSMNRDWPTHECDDDTCVWRCKANGKAFHSDLGVAYGPGELQLCHQRHVMECERITIKEDCSKALDMYGLNCLGWAGGHCMPAEGGKCSDIDTEEACTTGEFAGMGCIWNQKGCVLPDTE